jgi:hypothetical protein
MALLPRLLTVQAIAPGCDNSVVIPCLELIEE